MTMQEALEEMPVLYYSHGQNGVQKCEWIGDKSAIVEMPRIKKAHMSMYPCRMVEVGPWKDDWPLRQYVRADSGVFNIVGKWWALRGSHRIVWRFGLLMIAVGLANPKREAMKEKWPVDSWAWQEPNEVAVYNDSNLWQMPKYIDRNGPYPQ